MILIIDGYNLAHVIWSGKINDQQRKNLIDMFRAYAKKMNHSIIIVFDGGISYFLEEEMDELIIVYTGQEMSADDFIKEYLINHQREEQLLISSDTELNEWSSSLGIASISSQDFYTILQMRLEPSRPQVVKANQKAIKITAEENEELDKIMQQGSKQIYIKEEDIPVMIEQEKKKISKRDKFLLSKLKKL